MPIVGITLASSHVPCLPKRKDRYYALYATPQVISLPMEAYLLTSSTNQSAQFYHPKCTRSICMKANGIPGLISKRLDGRGSYPYVPSMVVPRCGPVLGVDYPDFKYIHYLG